MQGEKEKIHDPTEDSGQQQETISGEEPNPVGQDSAKNEYGEIGDESKDQPAGNDGEVGDRRSPAEGTGFILRQDSGAGDDEDQDIRPS